jgi:hypothetical protein
MIRMDDSGMTGGVGTHCQTGTVQKGMSRATEGQQGMDETRPDMALRRGKAAQWYKT